MNNNHYVVQLKDGRFIAAVGTAENIEEAYHTSYSFARELASENEGARVIHRSTLAK